MRRTRRKWRILFELEGDGGEPIRFVGKCIAQATGVRGAGPGQDYSRLVKARMYRTDPGAFVFERVHVTDAPDETSRSVAWIYATQQEALREVRRRLLDHPDVLQRFLTALGWEEPPIRLSWR